MLGGALTSCIDEDIDDCFSINRLTLSYKGDGTTEIFPDKICRVEMYVFDAENKCVNSHTLSDDELASRTALLPPLKAGDYRIVCVGNTHHTRVEGLTTCDFNKIVFADGDYFAGKQVSGNDSLYHASTSYTVLPFTGREEDDQTKTIEFASSHYDLFVEVVGIPAVGKRAGSLPVLEICGVSPCTDFENRACGEATDYLLETTYESGKKLLTARANIMRHMNHRDVNVCLRQASGEELLAEINRDWCLAAKGMGCHECVDVCNYEALELGADNVPVVDVDACNGCGACELACISLSAGSITAGATDRAIVVRPTEEVEA